MSSPTKAARALAEDFLAAVRKPPLSRNEALAHVRELLHGEEALACMPMELRHALDAAICEYGHAAAYETLSEIRECL